MSNDSTPGIVKRSLISLSRLVLATGFLLAVLWLIWTFFLLLAAYADEESPLLFVVGMHLLGWLGIWILWLLWRMVRKASPAVSTAAGSEPQKLPAANPLSVPVAIKMRPGAAIGMWIFGIGFLLAGIVGARTIADLYWVMLACAGMGGLVVLMQIVFQRTGFEPILSLSREGFRCAPLPEVRWQDVFGLDVRRIDTYSGAEPAWGMSFGIQEAHRLLEQMNFVSRWAWRILSDCKVLKNDTMSFTLPLGVLERAPSEVWATVSHLRDLVSPPPMQVWSPLWSLDELETNRDAEMALANMYAHVSQLTENAQVLAKQEFGKDPSALTRYLESEGKELEREGEVVRALADRLDKLRRRRLIQLVLIIAAGLLFFALRLAYEIGKY